VAGLCEGAVKCRANNGSSSKANKGSSRGRKYTDRTALICQERQRDRNSAGAGARLLDAALMRHKFPRGTLDKSIRITHKTTAAEEATAVVHSWRHALSGISDPSSAMPACAISALLQEDARNTVLGQDGSQHCANTTSAQTQHTNSNYRH
jgi:hypothetical protein